MSDSSTKPLVLVTGGAGYIGSHVTRMLLESGYRVRVMDKLMFGDLGLSNSSSHPRFEFQRGDILHVEEVVRALDGIEAVIHLAGLVGDPACAHDRDATVAINYEATKVMVEIAKYKGVKRFVFASTCSVYGAAEDYILNEGSAVSPVSLYAETNLRSEQVILRGFEGTGIVRGIVRFATVYGASERMRFDLVINILTAKAVTEKRIEIFGGAQWRPNVHVQDAARGLICLLESASDAMDGEIFNIGSNEQNHRISELGEIVGAVIPGTEIVHRSEQPDLRSYHVSFDKIAHVLGYSTRFRIEDGIREIQEILASGRVGDYTEDTYYNVKYSEV
ncbi:MAG: SDR family oxidoreductase [Candidatus Eisenbacteria sp.]|nr:SDR family oxidoreductase [Candidatus Eisenbacteria bacterium]